MSSCSLYLVLTSCSSGAISIVPCAKIINCKLDKRIGASDALNFEIPSSICVSSGDTVGLHSDGCSYGVYVVLSIEDGEAADGSTTTKCACVSQTARRLSSVLVPSSTFFKNLTFAAGLAKIQSLQPVPSVFATVNPAVPSLAADLASESTDNTFSTFTEIVLASRNSWRDRPDTGVMEIGQFGTVLTDKFVCAPDRKSSDAGGTVWGIIRANYLQDESNTVDAISIEGGSYSLGGKSQKLLLGNALAPAGFTKTTVLVPGGDTYYVLSRNGRPLATACTTIRSKRVTANSIAVEVTAPATDPTAAQIAASENNLMTVGIRYLNLYSDPLVHVSLTTPNAVPPCFMNVGDRVSVAMCDLGCARTITNTVFVDGISTTWASDNSVLTQLEVSNVLDSLADPLSARYGTKSAERDSRVASSESPCDPAYTVTSPVTNNGLLIQSVTFALPKTYSLAPAAVAVSTFPNQTWLVTLTTVNSVTIQITRLVVDTVNSITYTVTPLC